MKNILLLLTASIMLFATACSKQADTSPNTVNVGSTARTATATEHTITKAVADSLIGSYKLSVQGDNLATQAWLVTGSVVMVNHPEVVNVRAYLAHTPEWVKTNYGQSAGYNQTKLTIVVVGFDTDGYAVAFEEHFCPCPGSTGCYCEDVMLNTNGTFAVRQ